MFSNVKKQIKLNVWNMLRIKIKQNKRIEKDRVRGAVLSWIVRGSPLMCFLSRNLNKVRE